MYPVGRAFQLAAELAEEDINRRPDVLPGYRLILEPVNTKVRERERERERERHTHTHTHTHTHAHTHTHTQTNRETDPKTERDGDRQTHTDRRRGGGRSILHILKPPCSEA